MNTTRYALLPTEDWDNDYYSPVGVKTTNTADPSKSRSTKVWFYNPGSSPITITVETFNTASYTVVVPAGGTAATNPIPDGSGVHAFSDGMPFFALTQTDVEDGAALGTSSDWGKYNFRWNLPVS